MNGNLRNAWIPVERTEEWRIRAATRRPWRRLLVGIPHGPEISMQEIDFPQPIITKLERKGEFGARKRSGGVSTRRSTKCECVYKVHAARKEEKL